MKFFSYQTAGDSTPTYDWQNFEAFQLFSSIYFQWKVAWHILLILSNIFSVLSKSCLTYVCLFRWVFFLSVDITREFEHHNAYLIYWCNQEYFHCNSMLFLLY